MYTIIKRVQFIYILKSLKSNQPPYAKQLYSRVFFLFIYYIETYNVYDYFYEYAEMKKKKEANRIIRL